MRMKIIAGVVTIIVLTLLILSGPANAFSLKITLSDSSPEINQVIDFIVSLNINEGERLPVDQLDLKIGNNINCIFNPDGSHISGCDGLTIIPMLDTNYSQENLTGKYGSNEYDWGYGYGYEKNHLAYKIITNASIIGYGTHATLFEATIGGNKFSKSGKDLVIEEPDTSLNVISPAPGKIFSTDRVLFNIKTNRTAEYIQYYDNGNGPYQLCKGCDSIYKSRKITEGNHNITIEAIFKFGSSSESREVIVDSIKPRIISIFPRKITPINSAEFSMKYSEVNVQQVKFFIGNTSKIISCPSGNNQECTTGFDLTGYDGKELNFWFEIKDIAGNTAISRKGTVLVDLDNIQITVNSPINKTYDNSRIQLNIKTNEPATIEYSDNGRGFVRLCNNCEASSRVKKFSTGVHEVIFRATDRAGNSDIETVKFSVD